MRKTHNITLNVVIDVEKGSDGRRITWIRIKGWKHGVVARQNRISFTSPRVQRTQKNMAEVGKAIFDAARDMFKSDPDLK